MTSKHNFDLVIIGSGPGGYVAAVRAAHLGLKTAIVEKNARLGGICLNVGCIPSKALLDSSEYYHLAKEHFSEHGIMVGKLDIDLPKMMERKNKVVTDLTDQVRLLLEGNEIEIFKGVGKLQDGNSVEVVPNKGKPTLLSAKNILLATGSAPIELPGLAFDGKRVVNSTQALSLKNIPKHLGIVGGGYIGLELGSVWRRLGSKVTVIEMLPKIGMTLDGQVARSLDRILRKQGFEFLMNTKVTDANIKKDSVELKVVTGEKENKELSFDHVLVSVGRKPLIENLGLEKIGIGLGEKSGRIPVDSYYRTEVPNVYAIGDLIDGPMLAHKASAEGTAAVEHMAGKDGEVNYDAIPSVIYTWPEVASVGLTEEQIKAKGIPYCIGTYQFSGAGRARCMGEKDGFVKLISHSKTDRILGAHIIGPRAADMIAECVLAVEFGASTEDIARTIHGHPTFAEALQEAALSIRKCSIYAS